MGLLLLVGFFLPSATAAGWGESAWSASRWGEQDEICDGLDQNYDNVPDDGDVCDCAPGNFFGHAYMACRTQATYLQADQACFSMGMSLMELNDPVEDALIMSRLATNWPNKTWWVGGSDLSVEGSFEWMSGPMLYTNWYPGQPDNDVGGQDCVGIYPTGSGWFDMRCDRRMAFTCEDL